MALVATCLLALAASQASQPELIALRSAWTSGRACNVTIVIEDSVAINQRASDGSVISIVGEGKHTWRQEHVDTWIAVEKDALVGVRRRYASARGTSRCKIGASEQIVEYPGSLDGVTVVHESKRGRVEGRYEDRKPPRDTKFLQGHPMATGLERLLSDTPVAPGAEWTFDAEDLHAALQLSHVPKVALHPWAESKQAGEKDLPRLGEGFAHDYEWTCSAKLQQAEVEVDGAPCAVLALTAVGRSSAKSGGKDAAPNPDFEARLEGSLTWDRRLQQPRKFQMTGTLAGPPTSGELRRLDSATRKQPLARVSNWSCTIEVQPTAPEQPRAK